MDSFAKFIIDDEDIYIRVTHDQEKDYGYSEKSDSDGLKQMIKDISFEDVTNKIKKMSKKIYTTLNDINNPNKITVEFGIDFDIKGGKIISILSDVSGSTNFKIKIEWDNNK